MPGTTLQEFESVWPGLAEDILSYSKSYGLPKQALDWFKEQLYYNTVGGKCNRGMTVVDTASYLIGHKLQPGSDEYTRAAALGWMIELLQAFFLVTDDIMDSSKTRRGQPCWYLSPGVGMIAINDAFMLESSIYVLLKKHFRQEKSYLDLIELFHEVTFQTELGQECDLLTAPEDSVNLNNFSLEKFSFIVIFKTAYYSFYLPVALALHFCGKATEKNLKQAHDILIPMGEYFQAQDDYLDAFGDPAKIGKIGTDIKDNKCSWLVNQALKLANPDQRKVLDENYGRKDDAAEQKVKEVYTELKLQEVFQQFEKDRVAELEKLIDNVDESEGLQKGILQVFLKKIAYREK